MKGGKSDNEAPKEEKESQVLLAPLPLQAWESSAAPLPWPRGEVGLPGGLPEASSSG